MAPPDTVTPVTGSVTVTVPCNTDSSTDRAALSMSPTLTVEAPANDKRASSVTTWIPGTVLNGASFTGFTTWVTETSLRLSEVVPPRRLASSVLPEAGFAPLSMSATVNGDAEPLKSDPGRNLSRSSARTTRAAEGLTDSGMETHSDCPEVWYCHCPIELVAEVPTTTTPRSELALEPPVTASASSWKTAPKSDATVAPMGSASSSTGAETTEVNWDSETRTCEAS